MTTGCAQDGPDSPRMIQDDASTILSGQTEVSNMIRIHLGSRHNHDGYWIIDRMFSSPASMAKPAQNKHRCERTIKI